MFGRLSLIAASMLVSTSAIAQDHEMHEKKIDKIAHAETSALTCSNSGYSVDFDGIVAWKANARQEALADGFSAEEYDARMEEKIQLKYRNIEERYNNAARMVEDSDNRRRYKRHWSKRCKKLSEADETASYFAPVES